MSCLVALTTHTNRLTSSSRQNSVGLDIIEFLMNELSEGDEVLMRPMALAEHLNGLFAAVMSVALACSDELSELGAIWFAPLCSF